MPPVPSQSLLQRGAVRAVLSVAVLGVLGVSVAALVLHEDDENGRDGTPAPAGTGEFAATTTSTVALSPTTSSTTTTSTTTTSTTTTSTTTTASSGVGAGDSGPGSGTEMPRAADGRLAHTGRSGDLALGLGLVALAMVVRGPRRTATRGAPQ